MAPSRVRAPAQTQPAGRGPGGSEPPSPVPENRWLSGEVPKVSRMPSEEPGFPRHQPPLLWPKQSYLNPYSQPPGAVLRVQTSPHHFDM